MEAVPVQSRDARRFCLRFAVSLAAGFISLYLWGGPSFAVDRPDLVVTSISNPPAHVVPGASFSITATVQNQGAIASPATVTKFYLATGTTRKNLNGFQDVPALPTTPGSNSFSSTVTVVVFSDTLPGTYVLRGCADGDDVVIESSNTNNCTDSATSVVVDETPDLTVTSVSNPPSSLSQGGHFNVTATVKNLSTTVSAAASTTKYFLVPTSGGPGTKDLSGTTSVPALDPQQQFTHAEPVTVRTDTVPGQYFLRACADSEKVDPEVNENNNCTTTSGAAGTITVTAVADLAVTAISVSPLTVERGTGTITINTTVANIGLADAPQSTIKYVLVNADTLKEKNLKGGTQTVPAVPKGGSTNVQTTVTVYIDTIPGQYKVQACADSTKAIPETLESDNCKTTDDSQTVTVLGVTPANVDLKVTFVSSPPTDAVPGQAFSVTATVENDGTDTSAASNTRFFLVGSVRKNLKGSQPIGQLGPNASASPQATISVYSDTVPGTYTMQACADGDDQNDETDETNNCKDAGTITIDQAPDLTVTVLSNPPSTAEQGATFTIQNTGVKNIGPVATGSTTTVKYYLVSTTDGTLKDLSGTLTVPILNPGDTFSTNHDVTIQSDTLPGRYKLRGCADAGKVQPEGNESNNCKDSGGAVTVTASPNLVVTSVTVDGSPSTAARGSTLTIRAVVANQGLANANSSTMKYRLLNTVGGGTKNLKGTQTVSSISVGNSVNVVQTVTVYLDTPLGTWQIQACADSTKAIPESSEKDNCGSAAGTLTVTPAVTP
jgi:subtilase family serine protease